MSILLVNACQLLSPIISELFNESVVSGIFSDLKMGRIVPIFKKSKKISVENCRPITTLPVVSKIFEKLFYKRCVSFIGKYGLIHNNQFGFQANKSTSDVLLELLGNAYHVFTSNKSLAIFSLTSRELLID